MDALNESVSAEPIFIAFSALGKDAKINDQFDIIERENGSFNYERNSVDRILIADYLEYQDENQSRLVLASCYGALKPGRHIDVSVPDFVAICDKYLQHGALPNTGPAGSYKSFFDAQTLMQAMSDAGFYQLCLQSAEEAKITVRGAKPSNASKPFKGVNAVLSAPRFGPVMHWQNSGYALQSLGIPYRIVTGAFWHQVLSEQIEKELDSCEVLVVCDYDSLFTAADIQEMLRLLSVYPHVDAIAPLQYRRNLKEILGVPEANVLRSDMGADLIPMKTAHFGATCFRTKAFTDLPKPWFHGMPNEGGTWGPEHTDADVYFWKNWTQSGRKVCVAPGVRIGHLVESVVWPGPDFEPLFQLPSEMRALGPPQQTINLGDQNE